MTLVSIVTDELPEYASLREGGIEVVQNAEAAGGLFLCMMFKGGHQFEEDWVEQAVKPFEKHSVGLVSPPDLESFVLMSRRCFEHVGEPGSYGEAIKSAFGAGYTVIHCDALRSV